MKRVGAIYFDGRSTRRQPAELHFGEDEVLALGEFGEVRAAMAVLEISEPMGAAPRFIRFPGGQTFEVADLETLAACLQLSGLRSSAVVRMQSRWSATFAAIVGIVAVLVATYLWGLPAFSDFVAVRLPHTVLNELSGETLSLLDRHALKASQLSSERQGELAEAARRVLQGPGQPEYRLHFRDVPGVANAFALPSGDIVLFDGLVALAESDDEIVGVLAHELGHVSRRHGIRQMIRSSIVSFVVGFYLGDVSSLATGMGALLLQSRYSREFEFEADDFGARLMLGHGKTVAPLASMLGRLEGAHPAEEGKHTLIELLSTHPTTAERVARLHAIQR